MADPTKHLTVYISGTTTEATKDAVLSQLGLSHRAATVVRDVNGKVVQVVIKLPPTAAAAAINALSNTPGVSNITSADIIPGTAGFDGSADGLASIITAGWTKTLVQNADEVFNTDGTLTVTPTNLSAHGYWFMMSPQNILPTSPNSFDAEMKVRLDTPKTQAVANTDFYRGGISFDNGTWAGALQVLEESGDKKGLVLRDAISLSGDTIVSSVNELMHTYKVHVDGPTGLMTAYVDGTQTGPTHQAAGFFGGGPAFWFGFTLFNSSLTIDYFRCTTL